MKRKISRLIFILIVCGVFLIVLDCLTNQKPKDFSGVQILSGDQYVQSNLVYSNDKGEILRDTRLPKEKGVGYSVLRQAQDIVYFDSYPETATILAYDYSTQSLKNLGTLDKKYERINPYSQNLLTIINGGFAGDGISYRSGVCYLENEWNCLEDESDLHIWNGVMFKDKIYVYADSAQANYSEDGSLIPEEYILIYDKSFNLLEKINVNDSLNLGRDIIQFYSYGDKLFLLGEDFETGKFTVLEVNEELEVITKVSFSETSEIERKFCTPLSFFEESEGKAYLEISCEVSESSDLHDSSRYQEDNLLYKIDFDNLDGDIVDVAKMRDSRVVGIDFNAEKILVQDRLDEGPYHSIKVYDLNLQYLETIKVERFDNRMPTLVDISKMLD